MFDTRMLITKISDTRSQMLSRGASSTRRCEGPAVSSDDLSADS